MPIQTIISTSAARFENWFEDYTRKNLPFTIPIGEGHYLGLKIDHPFIFAIRDRQTGTILFVGRVVDPREGK
jgi:hypothetical protein